MVHPVSGNRFSSDAATGLVRVSTRKTRSLYLPKRQMRPIEIYRMDHLDSIDPTGRTEGASARAETEGASARAELEGSLNALGWPRACAVDAPHQ